MTPCMTSDRRRSAAPALIGNRPDSVVLRAWRLSLDVRPTKRRPLRRSGGRGMLGCGSGVCSPRKDVTRRRGERSAADVRGCDCFHGSVEPKRMIFACADFGFRAQQLRWSYWGRKSAIGRGTFFVNDCNPACVVGHMRRRHGDIMLEERRFCKELQKYVFMSGRVVYDRPFEDRFRTPIYPRCPS